MLAAVLLALSVAGARAGITKDLLKGNSICQDSSSWSAAGEPNKGCAWVAGSKERCAQVDDADVSAATACAQTCRSCGVAAAVPIAPPTAPPKPAAPSASPTAPPKPTSAYGDKQFRRPTPKPTSSRSSRDPATPSPSAKPEIEADVIKGVVHSSTLAPVAAPSLTPVAAPSAKPTLAPVAAPAPRPTRAPVAAAVPAPSPEPTLADDCVDSTSWSRAGKPSRNCEWVQIWVSVRCSKADDTGALAQHECAKACTTCDGPLKHGNIVNGPTSVPTSEPTLSMPTPAPTSEPTPAPTSGPTPTSEPTPDNKEARDAAMFAPTPPPTVCVDDRRFMRAGEAYTTNGREWRAYGCDWVGKNTAKRCAEVGPNGLKAAEVCCACKSK